MSLHGFLLFILSLLATAHGETHLTGDLVAPNLVRLNWSGQATDTYAVEMATNWVEGFQKTVARDLPASASANALTMEVSDVSQAFYRVVVASNVPPRNLFEDFEDELTLFVHDGAVRGGWCDVAAAPESPGLALRIGWDSNHYAYQEIHFDQPRPISASEGLFALRLYSPDPCVGGQVTYFNLRLSDTTGEIFQWMQRVYLDRAGWHDVFYPIRSGQHTVSWGDHADGVMDPPLSLLGFSLDYASGAPAAGMLDVDDIRFEPRADYGIRAQLVTSQFPSILRPGDESQLGVSLSNETSSTQSLLVQVELENECEVAVRHHLALTLPPHTSKLMPIPLPPDARRGLWRAQLAIRTAEAGSDTTQRETLSFALMEPAGPKPLAPGDGFLIGLHSHPHRWSATDREKEALVTGVCGARILRTGDFWESIQPESNRWEWSVMDDIVDLFGAQGIEIQAVLGFTPRWAAPPELRDHPDWWIWNRAPPIESAWRAYVGAFTARYANRIRFYEIWNEPDLTGFFRGATEEYLDMLHQAHEEIKSVSPALKVMTGGFALTSVPAQEGNPALHRRVLEEGQAWFDIHAFHGHGSFACFTNEVEGALLPLRSETEATEKPLYFNECAVSSTRIGQREQAETLFKKMLFAWSRGAAGYHWYNLRNDGFNAKDDEQNYGLLTHDFQPKAAYVAFNTLSAHFDGKAFIRSYDIGPDRHLLLFADDQEQILACWGAPTDYGESTITMQTGATTASKLDIMGNTSPLPIMEGKIQLTLSSEPCAIILDHPPGMPELLTRVVWQSIGPGGGGWLTALARGDSNTLYVGCDVGGVYRSDNNGESFRIVNNGLKDYFIHALLVDRTDHRVLYAATPGGVYKTTNACETWTQKRDGFPPASRWEYTAPVAAIAQDSFDASTLYAGIGRADIWSGTHGGNGSLYKSTNAGENWVLANSGIPSNAAVFALAASPWRSGEVWAASSEGLFFSTAAGPSWIVRTNGLPHGHVRRMAYHPSDSNRLFAVLRAASGVEPWQGGVYRSDNGGATWQEKNAGLPRNVGAPGDDPMLTSNYEDLQFDAGDPDTLYLACVSWWEPGVYKSGDGGENWQRVVTDNYTPGWMGTLWAPLAECLLADPHQAGRVWFGTPTELYCTDDGGDSWAQTHTDESPPGSGAWRGRGLETMVGLALAADPSDSNRIYAGYADLGLQISTDGGRSFAWSRQGLTYGGNTYSIAVDPDAPHVLFIGDGDPGGLGQFARSLDGGATWTPVGTTHSGLPEGHVVSIAIDWSSPVASRTLYVASEGNGIYRGMANGTIWSAINAGLPVNRAMTALMAHPTNPAILFAGIRMNQDVQGGIYKSNDRGASWHRVDSGIPNCRSLAIAPTPPHTFYAAAPEIYEHASMTTWPGGIFRSNDQGATWTQVFTNRHAWAVAVDAFDPMLVHCGANDQPFHDGSAANGVHVSRDGGQTWREINDGLGSLNITALLPDPAQPAGIYASTGGNGLFRAQACFEQKKTEETE